MLFFFQIIHTQNFSNKLTIVFLTFIWKVHMCGYSDFGSVGRRRENSECVFGAGAMVELSRKTKTRTHQLFFLAMRI